MELLKLLPANEKKVDVNDDNNDDDNDDNDDNCPPQQRLHRGAVRCRVLCLSPDAGVEDIVLIFETLY